MVIENKNGYSYGLIIKYAQDTLQYCMKFKLNWVR